MGQFGTETRKWLLSAVKQRRLLLKTDRSHKPRVHVEMALDLLDRQLTAYTFENDQHMSKFILRNADDITLLLPGKGSSSYEKKHREFEHIRRQAILLKDKHLCVPALATIKPAEDGTLF